MDPLVPNDQSAPLFSLPALGRSLYFLEATLGLVLILNFYSADRYGAVTSSQFFLVDPQGPLRYQGALDDATIRRRVPVRFCLRQAV